MKIGFNEATALRCEGQSLMADLEMCEKYGFDYFGIRYDCIAKYIQEFEIENKIKNRTLILPGKVAVLKGDLEAKLPGWNIVVGPTEAVQLVKFLKDMQAGGQA